MKSVEITIIGVTSLLQHRFGEAAQVATTKTTRATHIQEEDPRVIAEKGANIDKAGQHYFNAAAILRLLREAGGAHKQRGSRKAVKWLIPGAVQLVDDVIYIRSAPDGKPDGIMKTCEVDSRPVTIPATKGRVMRHRPRYDQWAAKFRLRINEDVLAEETIHQLLEEGGTRIGIGDYRPEKGGPFGTFRVVEWRSSK